MVTEQKQYADVVIEVLDGIIKIFILWCVINLILYMHKYLCLYVINVYAYMQFEFEVILVWWWRCGVVWGRNLKLRFSSALGSRWYCS